MSKQGSVSKTQFLSMPPGVERISVENVASF